MKKDQVKSIFQIEDILELPNAVTKVLDGDVVHRNELYKELIRINNYDLSFDWFQSIYEAEFAQRNQDKQDFTPNAVAKIASMLTGQKLGFIYEPTAGNGSMLITDWWERCLRSPYPLIHYPSENMIACWELSSRAIPILLLNLSIRGIMGYVFYGDTLTQDIKMKYILLNRKNDTMGFSEIIKDPDNKNWITGETLFQEQKNYKPFKTIY